MALKEDSFYKKSKPSSCGQIKFVGFRRCQMYFNLLGTPYITNNLGRYVMAHDAYDNNPKKELLTALMGILLLLAIIAGIGVSAWLRPAGDHTFVTAQSVDGTDSADIVNTDSATVAPAQAENAGVDAENHTPVTTTTADNPTAAPAVEVQATTPPEQSDNDQQTSEASQ